ncbi:hypothetical protein PTSG_11511, partial [Salpingoeca rosetta]
MYLFGGISPGNASLSIPFYNPVDAFSRSIDSDIGSISDMWRFDFDTNQTTANVTLLLASNQTDDFVLRNRGALVPLSSTQLVLLGLFGLTEPRSSISSFIYDIPTGQFDTTAVSPAVDDVALPALLLDDDRPSGGFSVSTVQGISFIFGHLFELRSGDEMRLWTARPISDFRGTSTILRWQADVARLQPVARTGAATMRGPGGVVYVFAGFSGILLSDLWKFTPPDRWEHLQQQSGMRPRARVEHTVAPLDNFNFLIFGGAAATSCLADLWRFDANTEQWTFVNDFASESAVASGFRGHSMVLHNDRLLVFGGKCGDDNFDSTVFILDIAAPFSVTTVN